MIVSKAVNMAQQMNIPVLGIIENYSWLECPDCGKRISVFGNSGIDSIAKQHGLEVLARIPIDPELAQLVDRGDVELFDKDYLDKAVDKLLKL